MRHLLQLRRRFRRYVSRDVENSPKVVASLPPLVEISLDGEPCWLPDGQYLGAALFTSGVVTLRHSVRLDQPRGLFCAMGICYECLVSIDGAPDQRACMSIIHPQMNVARSTPIESR